ncbi:MAG: ABC transporter substrate-binding protein [Comamonadaceae bacterium]|nr:ABC transporter substrate-binding protein [Comamonadaceae bacterium]
MGRWLVCMLLLWVGAAGALRAQPGPVYVGLDAEFGHRTSTSAQAIQQGIEIAIAEINQAGGVLGGRKVSLVTTDNRSITAVGLDNLRKLAAQPDLVAVFGGKFSPIYIEALPLVHEIGLPLLDPWGSADGITDHPYQPSYTFRLSIKDGWVGPAFVRFAREHHQVSRLGLLVPNTAWGRSNKAALEAAVGAAPGMNLVGHRWYNWGDVSLLASYQALREAGAQAIVLVANETEGSLLVREMAGLPKDQRLPVISHWGITGGEFPRMAGPALDEIDLAVVQSFSFVGSRSPSALRVLASLKRGWGHASPEQVPSPVGVAHAYDLMHLLARAVDKAGSTDRRAVRAALEQLGPYDGLVQRYARPFTPARHDALGPDSIFFARYTANDELIPMTTPTRRRP